MDLSPLHIQSRNLAVTAGTTTSASLSVPTGDPRTNVALERAFSVCGREAASSLSFGAPQQVVQARKPIKLDLGCGQNPKEGFDGVDLWAPDAKHKVDLFKFPWPFASDSVDEVHCSHFIEHIPNRDVEYRDLVMTPVGSGDGYVPAHISNPVDASYLGRDMLFAFFDELYRILNKDGSALIIWPALQSVRAFQDPTHRRFIPAETMWYLVAENRKSMGLSHYPVTCDFSVNVVPTMPAELTLLHPEAQRRRFGESWNVLHDFHATLKPTKKSS